MSDTAFVNYHVHSEQPQAFCFDVNNQPGRIISPELVPTKINVEDLRSRENSVSFDKHGITFEQHATQIKDFSDDSAWQEIYNNELQTLLRVCIGAKDVIVFDHTLRIDTTDTQRKPARNVHNDLSESGARQRLVDILGTETAKDFSAGHYGFVNVWRPVDNPVRSAPLGFIRPDSVDDKDWMTLALIYPDRVGQILGLAANSNHKWFYLSRMTPEEVAIFNVYDNHGKPFLGHSALDMQGTEDLSAPRKSIESRMLVRYS